MKKKDGAILRIAGAQLCSTVLDHRVVYHKPAPTTAKKITAQEDVSTNPDVQSALYNVQRKLDAALIEAVQKKDVTLISRLITQGADVNFVKDGLSPLHIAVMQKDLATIACLVAQGANVNIKGSFGNTPMHEAALNTDREKIKIAEVLIIAGADVNIQNDFGQVPLHFHVHTEYDMYMELAKLLVQSGARLHIKDIKGNEPLDRLPMKLRDRLIAFALYAHYNATKE